VLLFPKRPPHGRCYCLGLASRGAAFYLRTASAESSVDLVPSSEAASGPPSLLADFLSNSAKALAQSSGAATYLRETTTPRLLPLIVCSLRDVAYAGQHRVAGDALCRQESIRGVCPLSARLRVRSRVAQQAGDSLQRPLVPPHIEILRAYVVWHPRPH